jgi:hypothetical protein
VPAPIIPLQPAPPTQPSFAGLYEPVDSRRTFITCEWLELSREPTVRSGRTFSAMPRQPINSVSLDQCNAFDVAAAQR